LDKVQYPIPREKIVCTRCGATDALLWTDHVVDCRGCGIYDEDDPGEVHREVERVR
jgi:Zn ribbon nucleic-acid-binding protein